MTFARKGNTVGLESAYGTSTDSCAISSWSGAAATLQCHATTGAPVDSPVDIAYLGERG